MDPGVGMLGSSCDVLLPPAKKRRESGACEDPAFQVRTPASMQPNSTFLDLMFNAFDPRSLLPLDLQAERPAGAGAAGRPAPVRRAPSPGFRWFPFPSLPLFPDAVAIEPIAHAVHARRRGAAGRGRRLAGATGVAERNLVALGLAGRAALSAPRGSRLAFAGPQRGEQAFRWPPGRVTRGAACGGAACRHEVESEEALGFNP